MPSRLRHLSLAALCAFLAATSLSACGDTLQSKPISHNVLESLVAAPYPVYWLGRSFHGMTITEAAHDPSGSYSVQYGNCLHGGQGTCIPPLLIVTSPDNSFLPGGESLSRPTSIRGIRANVAVAGRAIVMATAGVVIDIYAEDPLIARAAAETIVPINAVGAPGVQLAKPLPDTNFGEQPLPSQAPSLPRSLR